MKGEKLSVKYARTDRVRLDLRDGRLVGYRAILNYVRPFSPHIRMPVEMGTKSAVTSITD